MRHPGGGPVLPGLPAGRALSEVACAGCGDGPLLAGAMAEAADLTTTAAIDTWLAESGWRPAGPWCPGSAAPRARLGARRAVG